MDVNIETVGPMGSPARQLSGILLHTGSRAFPCILYLNLAPAGKYPGRVLESASQLLISITCFSYQTLLSAREGRTIWMNTGEFQRDFTSGHLGQIKYNSLLQSCAISIAVYKQPKIEHSSLTVCQQSSPSMTEIFHFPDTHCWTRQMIALLSSVYNEEPTNFLLFLLN